jgi:hypothetical protein
LGEPATQIKGIGSLNFKSHKTNCIQAIKLIKCHDKKTLIFFFAFPVLSGKVGKQSLRFRAAKTFFFGITSFLYQNQNPVNQMVDGRKFCASLMHILGPFSTQRSVEEGKREQVRATSRF